jgi:hypothetical protein
MNVEGLWKISSSLSGRRNRLGINRPSAYGLFVQGNGRFEPSATERHSCDNALAGYFGYCHSANEHFSGLVAALVKELTRTLQL